MGCPLQSPLASRLGYGLTLWRNFCAKCGYGDRDDVGEDGPTQGSRAHMLAGDEIFTHGDEGERIPTRAMSPAVPQSLIDVDVEVIPGAASMLRVSTSEFSL